MTIDDILKSWRDREAAADPKTARWYIVAAAAMTASSCGPNSVKLYRLATESLPLSDELIVQRRIKEAILKTSIFYGAPKSIAALFPISDILDDEHLDRFAPRTESAKDPNDTARREAQGRAYFDTLWGPEVAEQHREKNERIYGDLYTLNMSHSLSYYISELSILSAPETQMCNAAALICSSCPVPAMWHTRGIVRFGGNVEDAAFAQGLALDVAEFYGVRTGEVKRVEQIDFGNRGAEFELLK